MLSFAQLSSIFDVSKGIEMLKNTKVILPLIAAFFLVVLITGCSKDELVEPCPGHEEPVYKNGGDGITDEGNGGGGISDGGDEESDSERNTK
jgi:hypothetical protein